MNNKHFTQVYDWNVIHSMSKAAKDVFCILAREMDKSNGVMMGHATLCGMTGLSSSSVKNGLKELAESGVIEITRAGRLNIYLLNPDVVWENKPWQRSEAKIPLNWIRSKEIK